MYVCCFVYNQKQKHISVVVWWLHPAPKHKVNYAFSKCTAALCAVMQRAHTHTYTLL